MSAHVITKEDLIEEQILQAAERLFAVYGLSKVTMEDVAKAIGKTRGSIYYYYKSKEEIVDAVIRIKINEIRTVMEKAVNQAGTAEEKIGAFFVAKLRLLRERHSFFDSLESGMDADAISDFNKTKIVHHDTIIEWEGALLTQVLSEGISKGEIAGIKKSEMDSVVFVLLSSLHGLKRELRLGKNVRDVESTVGMLIRIMMYGLKK